MNKSLLGRRLHASFWLCLIWFVSFDPAGLKAQERVSNSAPNFSFEKPVDPWQTGPHKDPSDLYVYMKPLPDGTELIDIRSLPYQLSAAPITDSDIQKMRGKSFPPGSAITPDSMEWKGSTVWGFKGTIPISGRQLYMECLQLPMAPTAVQIEVLGPQSAADDIHATITHLVSQTDGSISILQPGGGAMVTLTRAEGLGYLIEGLAQLAVIFLIGAFFIQMKRKSWPFHEKN